MTIRYFNFIIYYLFLLKIQIEYKLPILKTNVQIY